jgi:hypothetical protein
MDEEMNFPNPVVRTDLPTRRARWPKIVAGVLGLGLLVLLFLPQIVSSKVGRRFAVAYISGKVNAPVTVEGVQTSWFGPTSIRFLSIVDPMGRRIGFKSLTCKASLWGLLRGRYHLGETVIDGLHVDYVVDDGKGSDTWDRFQKPAGAAPAPAGPAKLAPFSGRITINSGTIVLHRGTVQPKLYNTTWESGRLEAVAATLDVPQGWDRPWKYTFDAETVEGEAPRGTISSAGTVDLGVGGRGEAKNLKLDVTLTGRNVLTGGLGAALVPGGTLPQDVRYALGPVLATLDVAVKAADGQLAVERCEAVGPYANVKLRLAADLNATPAVLSLAGAGGAGEGSLAAEPGVISLGVSKRLAAECLVYLSPFFREAAGGHGNVMVTLEQARVPVGRQWFKTATAKGRLTARTTLERFDEMTSAQQIPENAASQLALLTGDEDPRVAMTVEGPFAVAEGKVVVSGMQTTVRGTTLRVEGATALETGAIAQSAVVEKSAEIAGVGGSAAAEGGGGMAIAIGGTIVRPELGVLSVRGPALAEASRAAMNERIAAQVGRMRSQETKRLMQKSQAQVDEILRPLQPPATGNDPGTK